MVSVRGSQIDRYKQILVYANECNDDTIQDKINHDYQSVESYRFVNNFHDVAANTALGTYAHRVITHNLFDKSYKQHL